MDTTGIVALLQQRVPTIAAFYINNKPLEELSSPIGFLFGAVSGTDTMNSLAGPVLGQVFDVPNGTYEAVLANLTNPSVLRARLANVPVRANSYHGVPAYTLRELFIVSNEPTAAFTGSFVDGRIRGGLSEKFPNDFEVSMDDLNANAMCMYNDWKVQQHLSELRSLVQPRSVLV